MRAVVTIFTVLAFGLAGCINARENQRCDESNIAAVFDDPMQFDGRRFCGHGYFYSGDEIAGIYATPVASSAERYDLAFLLDARSSHPLRRGWSPAQNERIYVEGVMDAATCNATTDVAGEGCAPVARAIFLSDWSLRPAQR